MGGGPTPVSPQEHHEAGYFYPRDECLAAMQELVARGNACVDMISFAALQQEIMPKHGLNDEHHFHESCEHYVELHDRQIENAGAQVQALVARLGAGTAAAMAAGVAVTATAPAAVMPPHLQIDMTVPAVAVTAPAVVVQVPVVPTVVVAAAPAVPLLDPHTVVFSAWAHKEGMIPNIFRGFKKTWKKRWFRLTYVLDTKIFTEDCQDGLHY